MAKYTGGMKVGGGYYWNTRSWAVEVVPSEGGRLSAMDGARYAKVPFPVLFVIVPVLGGLFLVTLPVIGFALVAHAIAKKVTGGLKQGATELASTIEPGRFAAGEAHFTGKPGEEKAGAAPGDAATNHGIADLEKEIAARKGELK